MKLSRDEAAVLRRFVELYYVGPKDGQRPFQHARWMGVTALKCPLDLWIYQELMHELRPSLIVETGTRFGGTTLFLAQLCDLLGTGRVVSIDVEELPRPQHARITYVRGSSTDSSVLGLVKDMQSAGGRTLVILDSDHRKEHVAEELKIYSALLSPGDYLIVEDTNLNGHPVFRDYGAGPYEAVEDFLQEHPEFIRDRTREKFLLTFNPGGFLRRVELAASKSTGVELVGVAGAMEDEDPYAADSDWAGRRSTRGVHESELLVALQAQLADVTPAFQEALRQLEVAQEASAGFRQAVASLAAAAERERSLNDRLDAVSDAFKEALSQLESARAAGDGFRQAVAMLEEASNREGLLRARLATLEDALRQARDASTRREAQSAGTSTIDQSASAKPD